MFNYLICIIGLLLSGISCANVGVQTLVLNDKTRHRPIIISILYPTNSPVKKNHDDNAVWKIPSCVDMAPISSENQQYPLILFSHGDGGSRVDSAWFTIALAESGFIVAAIDHTGNTWDNYQPKIALERWQRPKDVSFVIKELLQSPTFAMKIDREKIGFAGYSLGGLTGVWLAGGIANLYQKPSIKTTDIVELSKGATQKIIDRIDFSKAKKSYREPLVKAEFIMAPAYGYAFDSQGLKNINIPICIIAGEKDQIVPIKNNAQKFAHNISKTVLKVMPKANHFIFINEPTELGKKTLAPGLISDPPGVDRHSIHREVYQSAIEFFKVEFAHCLPPPHTIPQRAIMNE